MDADTLDALYAALDRLEELDPSVVNEEWFRILERAADLAAMPGVRESLGVVLH